MKPESVGIIQILIASLLFALVPILVKYGESFGTYNIIFFRTIISVVALLIFFWIAKYQLMPLKHEIGKMILFGFLHTAIIISYFLAIKYLSVASAVFLLYSSSVWMIIFSYFILKEKISKTTIIALIISLIGLIFILDPKNINLGNNLFGSIMGLIGGIGFGLVYVLSKTFKKYDKVSLTFWQDVISLPFIIPFLFVDKIIFTPTNILIVAILGIFATTIPFILVFKGLEKITGQTGGVIILMDIIFPIILALLIFKEIPTIPTIIGGALIIVGSAIVAFNSNTTPVIPE